MLLCPFLPKKSQAKQFEGEDLFYQSVLFKIVCRAKWSRGDSKWKSERRGGREGNKKDGNILIHIYIYVERETGDREKGDKELERTGERSY